jgi:translation initiation factor 2 gamma subunit (eIF-2gamma)
MRRLRARPMFRLLMATLVSGLILLSSVATALAGNEPGPWP